MTVENGLTDYNMQEAVTRRMIIERSREIYVAADSSKIGIDVPIVVTQISKINYIVTDNRLSKNMSQELTKHNVNVIIAEE